MKKTIIILLVIVVVVLAVLLINRPKADAPTVNEQNATTSIAISGEFGGGVQVGE